MEPAPDTTAPWPPTAALFLAAVAGFLLTVVVAFSGSSIGAPVAVPVVLLGLAVMGGSLVGLFRRTGSLGRVGLGALAGVFAVFVGIALGSWSYDERYFGDDALARLTGQTSEPSAFWDLVSLVGAVLLVLGILLIVASPVALLVVGIRRRLARVD